MDQKAFLNSLFDFSFKDFVTTRIIRVIYTLAIFLAGIGALGILASGLASRSAVGILFGLLMAPVLFVVYVILARVWLEIVIVIFRIAENVQILADAKKGARPVATEATVEPPAESPTETL